MGIQGLFKVEEQADGEEGGGGAGHESTAGRGDGGGAEGVDEADGEVAEGGQTWGAWPARAVARSSSKATSRI